MFYKVVQAVEQIHALQIVHRDLKPENMFFSKDQSRVVLLDFGSSLDLDNVELRTRFPDNNPKRK